MLGSPQQSAQTCLGWRESAQTSLGQAFSTAPSANQACPILSGRVVRQQIAIAQPAVSAQPNLVPVSSHHDQISCSACSHMHMTSLFVQYVLLYTYLALPAKRLGLVFARNCISMGRRHAGSLSILWIHNRTMKIQTVGTSTFQSNCAMDFMKA